MSLENKDTMQLFFESGAICAELCRRLQDKPFLLHKLQEAAVLNVEIIKSLRMESEI